jgi:hypothetical protein
VGAEPRDNARGKRGGECSVLLVAAGADDFVQGAARQPAARQGPVDRGDAKRRDAMRRRRRPFDPPDPFAQLGETLYLLAHVAILFQPRRVVNVA